MLAIVVLIIAVLFIVLMKKQDNSGPQANTSILKEAGLDTSSHKAILDSSKKVIKEAEASRANLP